MPGKKLAKYQWDANIKDAADHFGVTTHTIHKWIKKGAPHQRVPPEFGGLPRIVFNLKKLKNWTKYHKLGQIKDPEEIVDVYLVTKLLENLRELGYTKKQIADKLKIPMSTLNGYLFPKMYRLKNAPFSIYLKTKKLTLKLKPTRHRNRLPKREEIIKALNNADGIRDKAAKALHVVYSKLIELIKLYKLENYVHYMASERLTISEIKKAIKTANGDKSVAAKNLDIHLSTLNKYIKRFKLLF